jgi:hypothetical protein
MYLVAAAGLPDGKFSYQKSQFLRTLEGRGMENVGTFSGNSEYFAAVW